MTSRCLIFCKSSIIVLVTFLIRVITSTEIQVSCHSSIFGEITPSSNTHHYTLSNNESFSNIFIQLLSIQNGTNINSILNIYDQEWNLLYFNDNIISPISFQPLSNIDEYIIEIKANNVQHWSYQMNITCTNSSSVTPTYYYYTTFNPSASPTPSPDLLFYDEMKKISSWTVSSPNHALQFPISIDSSKRCTDSNNRCIQVKGYLNEDCYIKRSVANNYKYYELQLDLTLSSMEEDDYCRVKYSFDDNSWIELNSYQGHRSLRQILNQSFVIDVNENETLYQNFYIKLEADGNNAEGRDFCYYDNVYLYGSQYQIYLPSTYPHLDSIQNYIECGDAIQGQLSNSTISHYYAFNNSMDRSIFIVIEECDCVDIYINLWDEFGKRIQTIFLPLASTNPISILSSQIYIVEVYTSDDTANNINYEFELKCNEIKKYLQCGDVISDQTTPEDDYHWYLFRNQYDGNILTLDTCQSEYYFQRELLDSQMNSVISGAADSLLCQSQDIVSYGLNIVSKSLSIGIYILNLYGFGGRYHKNYKISLDCSMDPMPIRNQSDTSATQNVSFPVEIQQYISCGESIWSQTKANDKTHYYAFKRDYICPTCTIVISLCKSQFDTYLYLRSKDLVHIREEGDLGDPASVADYCYNSEIHSGRGDKDIIQSFIGTDPSRLPIDTYLIVITDRNQGYGVYNLEIICNNTDYPSAINVSNKAIENTLKNESTVSCINTEPVSLIPTERRITKQCDITTIILAPDQVLIDGQNRWTLISLTQNTWHIKISLGDSWKFSPNTTSSITFSIDGSCGVHNADCDPLFAFSMDNTKYFAGRIRFDEYGRNKISPKCGQLLHEGNVEQLVHQNRYNSRRKAVLTDKWQPLYPSMENNIKFPAQYTIINNPIENTTTFQFTHSNTKIVQSCTWSESFTNNNLLHLYLSPDTNDELFNIYTINVSSKGLPLNISELSITTTSTNPPSSLTTDPPKPDIYNTMKHVSCGSDVFNQTTFTDTTHFYLFEHKIENNFILVELLLLFKENNVISMPFPLLHLRRSSDWSIIQSTNTNMLFQSLPIGFYILEITGTVTNIGFYRFDITCGHTSKPTAAPTYRPTAQTVSPSISPTLSPSNPTYAVPTAFPSATPTITNFKSRINCGESISGIFSSGENLHWYAFNIDEPGWREVIMELCVPNVKIAVILYDENDLPIWIEQNGVISTDESGNDGGANGARNPADCDTALYINKIEATKYHLPVGQYMILIDQRGYEVDGEKVKYELRVKCEIPSDASEIFKQLPLSAWLFTDAYDDPDCQNPAHLWWCSKHSYTLSSFFGVDMGALFTVYYFAAWGLFHQSESPSEWGNEWVTTFNLEFSDDGITFAEYDVNPILIPEWRAGGFWAHIGFLPEIRLEQPITARYFRFIPVDFHNAMTMGINAYGHRISEYSSSDIHNLDSNTISPTVSFPDIVTVNSDSVETVDIPGNVSLSVSIEDYVKCGTRIRSQIMFDEHPHYYGFIYDGYYDEVVIDVCGLLFQATVTLKDESLNDSNYNKSTYYNNYIQQYCSIITIKESSRSTYLIEIDSETLSYGVYDLVVTCTNCILALMGDEVEQVVLEPGGVHTVCEISTTIYPQASVFITSASKWLLTDESEDWHMKITLGEFWGLSSGITFKIDGSCASPHCYPIIAFVMDDTKYFAVLSRFDQIDENLITPQCNTRSLINRDITDLSYARNGAREVHNRFEAVEDGFQELQPSFRDNMQFPAEYTIKHDPTDNTIRFQFTHLYTAPGIKQSCIWREITFENDTTLTVYISPNAGDRLIINNISIKGQPPTGAPTMSPTPAPTGNPTKAPSPAPSAAPTRFPTMADAYDYFISVIYKFSEISKEIVPYLPPDVGDGMMKIKEVIETAYVKHQSLQKDWLLQYREFDLIFESINNNTNLSSNLPSDLLNNDIEMQARIECTKHACQAIDRWYNQDKFESNVTESFKQYFDEIMGNSNSDNKYLVFSVIEMSKSAPIHPPEAVPLVWITIGCTLSLILFTIMCLIIRYDMQQAEIKKRIISISNPMVIAIAIGFYDVSPPKDKQIDGFFRDLDGVRIDIELILGLFGKDALNYDIFPKRYNKECIDQSYKAYWQKDDLISLLKKQAETLETNLKNEKSEKRYDGLLVMISCHGIKGYIATSDYKKLSKTAIHRIFSKEAICRTIPRVFLFDCCSGEGERNTDFRWEINRGPDESESESESEIEIGKNIHQTGNATMNVNGEGDIDDAKTEKNMDIGKETNHKDVESEVLWGSNEDNPDYRLVLINGANDGFQSKMRTDTGSYLTSTFINKLAGNIFEKKNKKWLNKILMEIQDELHKDGKQLITKVFNNHTEYIKFEQRDVSNSNTSILMETEKVEQKHDTVEMAELDVVEPLTADTSEKQKEVDGASEGTKEMKGNSTDVVKGVQRMNSVNAVLSNKLALRNEQKESMDNVEIDGDEIMDELWTDAMEIVDEMDPNDQDIVENV